MRKLISKIVVAQWGLMLGISPSFGNVRPSDFDSLFPASPDLNVARFPLQLEGLTHFGFIKPNGDLVIPCKYERATGFRGGFAAVEQNGLWGLIDQTGAMMVSPQYSSLQPGLKTCYRRRTVRSTVDINIHGEWLIKPKFDFADAFSDGLGLVREGDS